MRCLLFLSCSLLFLLHVPLATPTLPSTFWLYEPENGKRFPAYVDSRRMNWENLTKIRFSWENIGTDVEYRLRISDSPSFGYDNFVSEWITENSYVLSVESLKWGVTYYWRVEARRGSESSLSEIRTFRVNSPPRLSNLLIAGKPVGQSFKLPTDKPVFSWTFVDNDNDSQRRIVVWVGTSENGKDKFEFSSDNYRQSQVEYAGSPLERHWPVFYVQITAGDDLDLSPWDWGVRGQFSLNQLPAVENLRIAGQVNPRDLHPEALKKGFAVTWSFSDNNRDDRQVGYQVQVGTFYSGNDLLDVTVYSENRFYVFPATLVDRLERGKTYYLRLRVHDNLEWGNWTYATFGLNVLPEIKGVTINAGERYTNSRRVTLTIDAVDEGGRIEGMMIEGDVVGAGNWMPFRRTVELELSGEDGLKWVLVWVMDNVGENNSVPGVASVVLDTSPPYGCVGTEPADGSMRSPGSIMFRWTIPTDDTSGPVSLYTLEIATDESFAHSQKFQTEKNYYLWTCEEAGTYYWRVRFRDKAGNENTTPVYSFTVDPNAPSLVLKPAKGITNVPSVEIEVSGTNVGSYRYSLLQSELWRTRWVQYQGPTTVTVHLASEGPHTIYFEARSPAGISSGIQTVEVMVDLTPPELEVEVDNVFSTSPKRTLRILARDGGSGVENMRFRINQGEWSPWQPYAKEKTITLLKGGPNVVEIQVMDRAGNQSSVARLDLYYSVGPPIVEVNLPEKVDKRIYVLRLPAYPGISLYVNDEKIEPIGGQWMASLYFHEGKNVVRIRTIDLTGREWENVYEIFCTLGEKERGITPLVYIAPFPLVFAGIYLFRRHEKSKIKKMEMQLSMRPRPVKPALEMTAQRVEKPKEVAKPLKKKKE